MKLKELKKISKSENSILIEGLPGIGNVGKIAADYISEKIKAKKIAEISSTEFPNLVIINEENLIEMPKLNIFYAKKSGFDIYLLLGDFQPNNEKGSFDLSELIIDYTKKQEIKEIITLGGVGLDLVDDNPSVYATGNDKKTLNLFKKAGCNTKVYGKVGTIIGVTGLLLGMAEKKPASALLAETTFDPGITAITSAKKLLEVINKRFKLKISLKELDNEFVDEENKHLQEVEKVEKISKVEETNYIG